MHLLDFFDTSTATMRTVLAALPDHALSARSGAGDWNGLQVVEHTLAVNAQARTMVDGVDVRVDGSTPDALDRNDVTDSYDRSAARTRTAFAPPEVQLRPLKTPMGLFPGRVVLSVTGLENLVHAWDLAVAAGRSLAFDPVAVGYAFRAIEDMPDVWHNFRYWGAYGPPLEPPVNATPTERLLALLGRDAWSPHQLVERSAGRDPRTQVRPTDRPTGAAWDDPAPTAS